MKKKTFLLIALPIALCCVILGVIGVYSLINSQKDYSFNTYTKEEVTVLFEENRDLFLELPRILETQAFWDKCRPNEGELHAFISSPYDEKRLSTLSKEDRKVIVKFFETLKPYMISLDYQKRVSVTFISSDQNVTGSYTVFYLYNHESGDKYPPEGQDPSKVSDVIRPGYEYMHLGYGWGMYYGHPQPVGER